MEINGVFNPLSAKRARDVLGVTSELIKRGLNVLDFGAKMDGTDDAGAYEAARARAGVDGTVEVPKGQFSISRTPTTGSTGGILWKLTGNKYGNGDVPVNAVGKDTVETFLGGSKFFTRQGSRTQDGPVLRIDGKIDHTNGSFGRVTSTFCVNTEANVNGGDFVWSINNIFTCRIPALGSGGTSASSQSVGHANMSLRPADALGDGLGPRGPLWGHLSQVEDRTLQPSDVAGPLINQEWNLCASGGDPGNSRIVHHITVNRPGNTDGSSTIGNAARFGHVTLVSSEGNVPMEARSYIGKGFSIECPWDVAAFDTSAGLSRYDAPAFKRGAGQYNAWDKDNIARDVFLDGAMRWYLTGRQVFSLNGDGVAEAPRLRLTDCPTSPSGLPSGSIWRDNSQGGVLKVV